MPNGIVEIDGSRLFYPQPHVSINQSLRGQAQGVLGNLPLESRQDFKELVKSLEERFSPSNQTELYRTQLRERSQRAVETLPELA
jgi:hypothetical protein